MVQGTRPTDYRSGWPFAASLAPCSISAFSELSGQRADIGCSGGKVDQLFAIAATCGEHSLKDQLAIARFGIDLLEQPTKVPLSLDRPSLQLLVLELWPATLPLFATSLLDFF